MRTVLQEWTLRHRLRPLFAKTTTGPLRRHTLESDQPTLAAGRSCRLSCFSSPHRRVAREDEVAILDGQVARVAGFVQSLVAGLAVPEVGETPAVGRGIFFGVLDHELNILDGSG